MNLKSSIQNTIVKSYSDAVELAARETHLPISTFPTECPYSMEQLLDNDF